MKTKMAERHLRVLIQGPSQDLLRMPTRPVWSVASLLVNLVAYPRLYGFHRSSAQQARNQHSAGCGRPQGSGQTVLRVDVQQTTNKSISTLAMKNAMYHLPQLSLLTHIEYRGATCPK